MQNSVLDWDGLTGVCRTVCSVFAWFDWCVCRMMCWLSRVKTVFCNFKCKQKSFGYRLVGVWHSELTICTCNIINNCRNESVFLKYYLYAWSVDVKNRQYDKR